MENQLKAHDMFRPFTTSKKDLIALLGLIIGIIIICSFKLDFSNLTKADKVQEEKTIVLADQKEFISVKSTNKRDNFYNTRGRFERSIAKVGQ